MQLPANKNAAVLARPGGVVDTNGFTVRQLMRDSIPQPAHRIFTTTGLAHSGDLTTPIT